MSKRRIAVITGGSAGVGRATALRLAELGFDVAPLARNGEGLDAVAAAIEQRGARALPLVADVAEAAQVDAAADRVAAQWGGFDVWINCAMVTVFSRFDDVTPQEYRRVTDVTYHGQVFGTQAALRHMRPRDHGTIVQVGSALAYRSIPLQSAYCGAKHAVVGFTESLRTELMHEHSRIQLAMVHLPAVNTPQFAWARTHVNAHPRPAGRPVEPEVAARAIADAALHPRREIYLGWSTIVAIMGNMALPTYGDVEAEKTWSGQLLDRGSARREGNLFAPVTDVRRDRGPFAAVAEPSGVAISGLGARIGLGAIGAAGIAALLGVAWTAGRRSGRGPR